MIRVQEITLDVYDAPSFSYVNAKQDDNISRQLVITLTDNGTPIKPDSETEQAVFRVLKPDGHSVLDQAIIGEDGRITVALSDQALACPGQAEADVAILKGEEVISSAIFFIQVVRSPLGEHLTSENEFLLLVDATKAAEKAAKKADTAAGVANEAAENANAAAEAANDEATHPGRIINGTWHYWDREKGEYVDTGIDGTVSLSIAEVITGEPGTKAKVENIGTDTDIQLKITIPRGEAGGVTGIKGNAETDYRKGDVNLTPADIGLGNVPNVATDDQTPTFIQADSRTNLTSGEKLASMLGKIAKWFADLKAVAFSGKYSDLIDKPTIPTELKNPKALSFTGGETGSYDGSVAKTVNIPTVPAALKNPKALTFTGGASGSYDGSAALTVTIPTVPASLKNPKALTFTGGATGSYDGSAAKTVAIPNALASLTDGVWKAGNTLAITNGVFPGYLSGGSKTLTFMIPVGKPITAAGVKTTVCTISARGVSGPLATNVNFLASGYSTKAENHGTAGFVIVAATAPSAFSGAVNNTPVTVTGSVTLSFAAAADEGLPGPEIFDDEAGEEGPSIEELEAAV